MAFAATLIRRTILGNMKAEIWAYVNTAGGTGGDIPTGIRHVFACILQPHAAAVTAAPHVVNETIPTKALPMASSITIVTTADEDGVAIVLGTG